MFVRNIFFRGFFLKNIFRFVFLIADAFDDFGQNGPKHEEGHYADNPHDQ